jgi:2,3-dihydroxybiphenyl 1,2-dioxygenase
VLTVGWEVRDHPALQRVQATLDGAGVAYKQLSPDEAEARRVEEVITFEDPAGTTLEVFHGAVLDHSPVVTPFGARFVTGDQGMGHVVVPATDPNGLFDFYTEVLGFRARGAFRVPLPKEFGPVRVRFLGINERHHSLAIVPAAHQRDPRLVHIMVEVDTLDAVGQALDRVNAEGFQLSSTLGRHTNDKMVSFYVRAPGDWDIEFGTDGMRVDETYYTAEEITADSYWGHQWVGEMPAAMRL